jgi:tetratricopeptide (TPR) repeat protein
MDNKMAYANLIYLGLYRLAIIAAGLTSIVLGYLLFVKGVFPYADSTGSGFDASIAGTTFSLQNAAPGSLFALFGIIVTTVMIVRSPPEVSFEAGNRRGGGDSQTAEAENEHFSGSEKWTFKSATRPGSQAGDLDNQSKLAAVLNNLAWDFHDRERSLDAQAAARLAVHFEPQLPDYLDTLAEILYHDKQYNGALKYKEQAANLDPKLEEGIEKFRQAVKVDDSS